MVQTLKGSNLEERVARLNEILKDAPKAKIDSFREQFDMSWIYHDSVIEGVVYTNEELVNAFHDVPPPDSSVAPIYDEIRNHRICIEMIREQAARPRFTLSLDTIKDLFAQLAPEELEGKAPPKYRKDMPHQRLYFHDISEPDKIGYEMRQIVHWVNDPETKKTTHPVRLASKAHFDMLHTYPFPRHSGKVARLVMNLLLLRAGYPPAVLHASERQRYFEALKNGEDAAAQLVQEALGGAVESTIRFFEEGV